MDIEPLEVVWQKHYDEINYLESLRVEQFCNGHEPRRGRLGKQSIVRVDSIDIWIKKKLMKVIIPTQWM